jgi:hypothetical protein
LLDAAGAAEAVETRREKASTLANARARGEAEAAFIFWKRGRG